MFPLKDNIPTDRLPLVTIVLIAINVVVYFALQKGGIFSGPSDSSVIRYGVIPYEVTHLGEQCVPAGQRAFQCGDVGGQPSTIITIFTSMFLHGSILHLGGNMLFLWIFGNNVEDSMGRVRYVVFYLLGGVAAVALQTAVGPDAVVPSIGASGAIAAVLGGYLLLYPRARVVTLIFIVFFFTIIELPALLILGFWFLQQIAFGFYDLNDPVGGAGGVAYFAHIGGFALGLLAIRAFAQRTKSTPTARYPVY